MPSLACGKKLPDSPPPKTAEEKASYYGDIIKSKYNLEATLEFCRNRKSMSVLCRNKATGDRHLFVKGAAELLLERCTQIMRSDGSVATIISAERSNIAARIIDMANRPLRTLGLAVKTGIAPGIKIIRIDKGAEYTKFTLHPLQHPTTPRQWQSQQSICHRRPTARDTPRQIHSSS